MFGLIDIGLWEYQGSASGGGGGHDAPPTRGAERNAVAAGEAALTA